MYYLGIDSGATKAAFLLTDENGKVITRYIGPGCAVLGARKAGVKKMLQSGIEKICEQAGITKDDIRALGLAINGYGEGEGTEQETQEACAEAFFPDRYVCNLDTYGGWIGSLLFEPGINVIAGTGSVVFGVASDGRTARSGGWGAGCDEGSCSWHGQRLVEAFTKQSDGRMKKTPLYDIFKEKYGIEDDEHCILKLNREIVRGIGLAALQYALKEAYDQGDETAKEIYEAGARELFQGIKAVSERLGFRKEEIVVSYTGGLFKSGACAIEPLRKLVEDYGGRFVTPCYGPDVGAVMMAMKFVDPSFDAHQFKISE